MSGKNNKDHEMNVVQKAGLGAFCVAVLGFGTALINSGSLAFFRGILQPLPTPTPSIIASPPALTPTADPSFTPPPTQPIPTLSTTSPTPTPLTTSTTSPVSTPSISPPSGECKYADPGPYEISLKTDKKIYTQLEQVKATFKVEGTPNNYGQFIQIIPAAEPDSNTTYTHRVDKNGSDILSPQKPGSYQVRLYINGGSGEVLVARCPVLVKSVSGT
jgi:hypothetical protein